jgi:hypothetical protein
MRLDDIHRLVSALPMDWVGLVTEARQWRVSAPVYAGLVATRELFGTAIPRGVLERLAPGPMRRHLLHRNLAAQWRGCEAADAAQVPHLLFAENWWELARSLGGVRIPAAIRSSMARRVSDRRRSLIRSLRFLQGD